MPGLGLRSGDWPLLPLILALVPLQKFPIQWKSPLQSENGHALSIYIVVVYGFLEIRGQHLLYYMYRPTVHKKIACCVC